jgi:hypothetical protein
MLSLLKPAERMICESRCEGLHREVRPPASEASATLLP